MENQFLREVARAYVINETERLGSYAFVFPNRRSMKFFCKYIGEEYGKIYGKPLIAPHLITINELFSELSGLTLVDSVEALYILYCNYAKLKPIGVESFDEFIHWGDLIIKDFDDIDKYLVDAAQLFTNIKDLKQLDSDFSFLTSKQRTAVESFWRNFLRGNFSDKKDFFASTWDIMYNLYCNFRNELLLRNLGYEGQIYRTVAQNCSTYNYKYDFVFIGLNAPNNCERTLMNRLRDAGKADFYWDFYGPLLTDRENSASDIISECVKDYSSKYILRQNSNDLQFIPKIKVIGVPSGVGQAFAVAKILNDIAPCNPVPSNFAFNTAVVLPNEQLLMPVLNSIPKAYNSINVTMGYPIAATSFISFMNLICDLQRDVKKKNGEWYFYHKSLVTLLMHEYMKKIAPIDVERIRRWIVKGNMIYIAQNEKIFESESSILDLVFKVVCTPAEIAEYEVAILKELDKYLDSLEREFIYQYYLRINRLSKLNIPMEAATYFRFISKITSGIAVPFRGEPLSGLQVMGSLETRALDFENVIITSVNEGTFPSSNTAQSLIPYNLRCGFGLPTYELQDGIAAYHFYRSIARAKNVFLIYDTRSEGLNSGEVSRYVKQLKYHFNIKVEESVATAIPVIRDKKSVEVVKSPQVIKMLKDKYIYSKSSALSASALNNYITCPLKFYFENVEGVGDEEEVAESVESNTFGTLYHGAMQSIYDKYKYEIVSTDILKAEADNNKNLEAVIKQEFKKSLSINEVSGQNIIIMELLKKYIKLTFKEDENYAPFTYIASEEVYRYGLPINDRGETVNFKATVDRIDKLKDNILRIIDYKTGVVEKPTQELDLELLFSKSEHIKYKELLQLYLYAFIVNEMQNMYGQLKLRNGEPLKFAIEDDMSQLELVIYPLRKIKDCSIFNIRIYKKEMELFKVLLKECVEEIFNPQVPFAPNTSGGGCKYCKFNTLCGQ
ncbi:MAG: PD-(D/E)XK nuclease family protein [Bacteroidales bacterium]